MLSPDSRPVVMVSGGKDSLVLWEVLNHLGYPAHGLHLDQGIGDYSRDSRRRCQEFARERGFSLHLLSLPDILGCGIQEVARVDGRKPCAACGLIKRHFFNRFARERGYDVVATGHNLDDEAATLLGNLLRWQTGYLARQTPVLPASGIGLVPRVKPLYRLTERETSSFAVLHGIEYVVEECPLAAGARSIIYKQALNDLERHSPGTKLQLYQGFLERARHRFQEEERVELGPCSQCGQPTSLETCAFCHLLQRLAIEPLPVLPISEA